MKLSGESQEAIRENLPGGLKFARKMSARWAEEALTAHQIPGPWPNTADTIEWILSRANCRRTLN